MRVINRFIGQELSFQKIRLFIGHYPARYMPGNYHSMKRNAWIQSIAEQTHTKIWKENSEYQLIASPAFIIMSVSLQRILCHFSSSLSFIILQTTIQTLMNRRKRKLVFQKANKKNKFSEPAKGNSKILTTPSCLAAS